MHYSLLYIGANIYNIQSTYSLGLGVSLTFVSMLIYRGQTALIIFLELPQQKLNEISCPGIIIQHEN